MSLLPEADLAGWLAHLERLHPQGQSGIELGLDRVLAVKQVLGQAKFCPLITVAGTNGKGSTCALLERILRSAGYRVGLYTSPHLLRYNERICIDGRTIDDAALCAAFDRVETARNNVALTYFEFGTLAAWECFSAAAVEVVIFEVGLGGRLDATNAYDADCAIVTTVDLDHQAYLGNTREAIGREKAGICRSGRPLICGDADPPASLVEASRLASADFLGIGQAFGYERMEGQWLWWHGAHRKLGGLAYPALRGSYQLANASCALSALDVLQAQLPVAAQDIRHGLVEVELAGRCQVLPGRPQLVLDVAHNPQAAMALADNLGNMGFAAITWAVCGMLADKDIDGVVGALMTRVDHWLLCDLEGPRAALADRLADALVKVGAGGTVRMFANPAAALDFARENAKPDDRILAFGSFLTVAEAMRSLALKTGGNT